MKKIILIIGLAALLRLAFITGSPPSLYWEEAALGYDAYSILKTGKDFHGHPFPLVAFESFGDWKPSGYFYILVPFIALFGLNETAVRLPSALAGIATVGLVYLIAKQISKREPVALWSALMLAIMPWHIQFSRAGFEVNMATGFLTWGVYLFLRGRTKPFYLLGAMGAMVASMYTYHGLRLLAPLVSLLMIISSWRQYQKERYFWLAGVIGIVLIIPMAAAFWTPQIQQRILETSLFSTSPAVAITNAERAADGNTLISHIIHHRYWYWGKEILAGSASHLNPGFLFLKGDDNNRHQTGFTALLYPWTVLPLIIGLITILFKRRHWWWVVGWILLATLPPALTNVTPHTLRFLPAAPALALIMGLGMDRFWCWLAGHRYPKVWQGVLIAVMLISVAAYTYDLRLVYPKRASQDWQYGYKQVIQTIKDEYNMGTPITITRYYGRPSIYALFYLAIDPKQIQKEEPRLPKDQGELLAFDQVTFGPPSDAKQGLVVSEKPLLGGQLVKTIPFLDGKQAYFIYVY